MSSPVTSQLLSVTTLLAVVAAPLPLLFHILSGALLRSRVPALVAEKMLVLLVLWSAVQSLLVALLGWVGCLRLSAILLLEGALLIWGVWLIRRAPSLPVRLRRDPRGASAGSAEPPPAERWLWALICGVVLFLTIHIIRYPVDDWDSIAYQLPRVAHWYQLGTFMMPMAEWGGPGDIINAYPYSWSMLFLLALAPVGHDQFVLMANVVAWLVLGLSTYALARLVGGHRFAPTFAAVLVLFMPLTILSVYTAHNDLPLGAFLVASVYFTMDAWWYKRGYSRLMALICLAIVAGTKMSGIAYCGLVGALSLWLFLLGRVQSKPAPPWVQTIREEPLMTGLAAGSVGLLGVSWYVHNALVAGNPFGFVQISLFGRVLWHGWVTPEYINKTNLLHNFSVTSPQHWELLLRSGIEFLGLPGLALVMLSLGAPCCILRRSRARWLLLTLVCVCLASLYLFIAGPWSAKFADEADMSGWTGRQMRYAFPFWGLLAAAAGAAVRVRPSGWAASSMIGLATLEAIRVVTEDKLQFSKTGLLAACAAMVVFFGCRVGIRRRLSVAFGSFDGRQGLNRRIIGSSGMVVILVVGITLGTTALRKVRYEAQDVLWGGISRFADNLPAGTRVGFWPSGVTYLLYGKRFQQLLLYLPLDAQPNSDEMLRYLRARPIDVIAVGPRTKYNDSSPVWTWIVEKRRHFERLQGEDPRRNVLVYRLSPSGQ